MNPSAEAILRCELCSKPFDKGESVVANAAFTRAVIGLVTDDTKEASLKRHSYYCRDKKGTSRKIRIRSCELCVRAKTRCDGARPSCGRCAGRQISCVYPISKANFKPRINTSMASMSQPDIDGSTVLANAISASPLLNKSSGYVGATDSVMSSLSTPSSLGLPDWGIPHGDLSFENRWGPVILPLSPLGQRDAWTDQTFIAAQSDSPPIPRMPDYHLRSFGQSNSIKFLTSPSATLMTHILASFPKMMYSPGSLPPFVHPYSLGNNLNNFNAGFESLATCATLMQILSGGTPGSRRLFWKNVRLECERLKVEVHMIYPAIWAFI